MLTRIRSQLPLWRRALRRRRRTLALLTGALLVAALLPSALPALVPAAAASTTVVRSEEHTSELQSRGHLVCRLLLEKKKATNLITQSVGPENVVATQSYARMSCTTR